MTDNLKESYKTLALADTDLIEQVSGETIPSEEAVSTAKEWVDSKEM